MTRIIFFYLNKPNKLDKAICCSNHSILITEILLNNIVLYNNKYSDYCSEILYPTPSNRGQITDDFYFKSIN